MAELKHVKHSPDGLAHRAPSISGNSVRMAALLLAHSWEPLPPVLTFCLVLRGCDFNFSSLLLEILRNCLRSP